MHRTNISTGGPWEPTNGYSRCVKIEHVDHTNFFFAGTTAMNPNGTIEHEGDAGGQAREILERIGAVLQEHGASLADVVATRMYVTDAAHAGAVGLAHGAAFKDIRPAATLVVVAGLVDPKMLVEIEAHAVAPRASPRAGPAARVEGVLERHEVKARQRAGSAAPAGPDAPGLVRT